MIVPLNPIRCLPVQWRSSRRKLVSCPGVAHVHLSAVFGERCERLAKRSYQERHPAGRPRRVNPHFINQQPFALGSISAWCKSCRSSFAAQCATVAIRAYHHLESFRAARMLNLRERFCAAGLEAKSAKARVSRTGALRPSTKSSSLPTLR